ncbi:hypothetical protein [Paenibacillus cymbidii]|uniref:hypothetical protein n=1 Tax=Paenibacillus cymbidii TaxID=1639034 RepID=UPI0010800E71|nr:hypothetical protein [Paenibacillus cymbidii]
MDGEFPLYFWSFNDSFYIVEKVAKKEPYNRGVFEERYSHAMVLQQPAQALDVMLDGIRLFPWDTQVVDAPNPANNRSSFYERALDLMGQLGVAAANNNDAATKKKYFDQAQALFATVAEKQQFLTTLPKSQLDIDTVVDGTDGICRQELCRHSGSAETGDGRG